MLSDPLQAEMTGTVDYRQRIFSNKHLKKSEYKLSRGLRLNVQVNDTY